MRDRTGRTSREASMGAASRLRSVSAIVSIASVAWLYAVAAAVAHPGSGPHETVDLTTTTTLPGASAGLGYAATYHGTAGPRSRPPALRELVIDMPPGTKMDTGALPQCDATDAQLMALGEAACPPR